MRLIRAQALAQAMKTIHICETENRELAETAPSDNLTPGGRDGEWGGTGGQWWRHRRSGQREMSQHHVWIMPPTSRKQNLRMEGMVFSNLRIISLQHVP